MKLSIVIPAYNEVNTLPEVIRRTRDVPGEKEILVVDDGSTDGTSEILGGMDVPELRTFFHPENRGKGAALRTAFEQVRGDVVVIQDGDLEYQPEEIPRLVDLIARGKADVVYGSRFAGHHRVFMFTHYVGNKVVNLFANVLYNTFLSDLMTGHKAFRADLLRELEYRSNRFGFEPEFTAYAFKRHLRVYEVPVAYEGRTYAEGKKIKWFDGLAALGWLLRARFRTIHAGQETLDALAGAERFNRWLFDQIGDALGDRVLEIGSGVGNMTRYLLSKKLVVASDVDDLHLERLRGRFVEGDRFRVVHLDASRIEAEALKPYHLDTVIGLNVLEHLEDDEGALSRIHGILPPGGRVVLAVPALPSLYGSLDRALAHHRRYGRSDLRAKLERAGFSVERLRYFNLAGVPGWWLNGTVLRRQKLPGNQVKLFDLLVPLFHMEKRLGPSMGLSLIAVGRKT
jgi:glycosyltransferase involved in cell wall biosynthesis